MSRAVRRRCANSSGLANGGDHRYAIHAEAAGSSAAPTVIASAAAGEPS